MPDHQLMKEQMDGHKENHLIQVRILQEGQKPTFWWQSALACCSWYSPLSMSHFGCKQLNFLPSPTTLRRTISPKCQLLTLKP
ncbi:hypothetical protein OYC64_018453 [Pagothenia borchgrevinki]|uniref:Uncharacterized protein n=1 Tax=Pagothenia borchgrevinki TaxID=8213 RepID=A0ABD2GQN0_PAGBO